MLKFKKTHSLHQLVKQNSTDTKKLFKQINELAGNKDENPLPEAKSYKDLVEKIAQFFLSKIEKIREQFESSPTYNINNKDVPKLDKFIPVNFKRFSYHLVIENDAKYLAKLLFWMIPQ